MRWFCLSLLLIVLSLNAVVRASRQAAAQDKPGSTLASSMLAAQNEMRKIYEVPPLAWDETLAASAQDWASKIAAKGVLPPEHRANSPNGENFFWGTAGGFEPKDAVDLWGSEVKNYDLRNNTCAAGKSCYHFTQIVWSTTTKVGCGKATSTDGQTDFFVCDYYPAGNIIGQSPFTSLKDVATIVNRTIPTPNNPSATEPTPTPTENGFNQPMFESPANVVQGVPTPSPTLTKTRSFAPLITSTETQKVRQSPAGEVKAIPPEMTRRFRELRPQLQPTASAWVNQQAHALAQKTAPDLHALEIAIRGRFDHGNNLSNSDLEAVAFIVMMQATNDMDKDLTTIMDEVKSMTAAKARLRDLISQINKDVAANPGQTEEGAPCLTPLCRSLPSEFSQLATMTANLQKPVRINVPPQLTFANLRALENELEKNLDSMNEVSEMTSMRLEMMMDRRSKFISTLSNIMKKISTTQDTLVQNLK